MAGLLSRFTTFIPNATILSNDHNQELNRIVNLLNGTTTNLKTALKTSDAGDPPLELDQLSTGPILKGFQGGIEKFRFRNDGSLRTPGIFDSNDNEELLFVVTGSAVNEITIANAATGGRPKIAASGGDANIDLELAGKGTGLIRLPSTNPSNADHATRKGYVDGKTTLWAATFTIPDIAARGVDANFDNIPAIAIPGSGWVCTELRMKFLGGSASGSFQIDFRKQPAGSASETSLGTITFNPGTINVETVNNISDHAFTANDYIYAVINSTSSPLQKAVWCSFVGFKPLE